MSFDYSVEFTGEDFLSSFFSGFMTAYLIVIVVLAISAAVMFHFVEAKGLYTIAKRRGIAKPHLAYIPIVKLYTLGKIAEQFELAQYGKTRPHAKRLLGFGIPYFILSVAFLVFFCTSYFAMFDMTISSSGSGTIAGLILLMVIALALEGIGIAYSIFSIMAYYKVFRSLDPKTCVTFTILAIVVGVTTPFVINKKRNMDDGFVELKNKYEAEQHTSQY